VKEFKVCPQCKTARYCSARNKTGLRVGTRLTVAHHYQTVNIQRCNVSAAAQGGLAVCELAGSGMSSTFDYEFSNVIISIDAPDCSMPSDVKYYHYE